MVTLSIVSGCSSVLEPSGMRQVHAERCNGPDRMELTPARPVSIGQGPGFTQQHEGFSEIHAVGATRRRGSSLIARRIVEAPVAYASRRRARSTFSSVTAGERRRSGKGVPASKTANLFANPVASSFGRPTDSGAEPILYRFSADRT